ncbi:MAG: UPF0280 family protein [Dehalococcoidaceae bacterium]|nr:UPF0280 family protein [Dehalococcoidaceae bacterium]
MYEPRNYRHHVQARGLISFQVGMQESDLFILAGTDLSREAIVFLEECRSVISGYIRTNPEFGSSLSPLPLDQQAHAIVREMYSASLKAGVGPMAGVAGAIAEFIGRRLLAMTPEIIIENGGDIFIKTAISRRIGIYAGNSPLSGKIGLAISPEATPAGICTSSGTVGPSLSFGKADAAVVLSHSCTLADAAATAIGNTVTCPDAIAGGLDLAKNIEGISGAVIIIGDSMGAWGDIELVRLD